MLLIAAALAGGILLALGGIIMASGSRPLGIDEWVHDRAVDLANGGVIRVATWITHLGDSLVAWVTAGVVTVTLLAVRRFPHALAVGGGMVLAVVLVRVGKSVVDRARPLDAVAHGSGTSFPSGHSTYGVMWLVLGIVATLVIPRLAGRRWPVILGGVITLLIPVTRVYLRPHWATDVIGGLSAGTLAFALAGALAIWLTMKARPASETQRPRGGGASVRSG
jgi:membrane-associated phospholipid phosphatase